MSRKMCLETASLERGPDPRRSVRPAGPKMVKPPHPPASGDFPHEGIRAVQLGTEAPC